MPNRRQMIKGAAGLALSALLVLAAIPTISPGIWSQEPAGYEQSLAHRLIDAGADAYVGHGPHQLRGIEIYKGRPILYSVGNFFYDDLRTSAWADMFEAYGKDPRVDTDAEVTVDGETKGYPTADGFVGALAAPIFYESVITVNRFEQNRLAELRLYPVELGYSKRGIPRLVTGQQANAILERLQKLSEPFVTEIAIENDVGVIRMRPSSPDDAARMARIGGMNPKIAMA